jgi:hypothetical protein
MVDFLSAHHSRASILAVFALWTVVLIDIISDNVNEPFGWTYTPIVKRE